MTDSDRQITDKIMTPYKPRGQIKRVNILEFWLAILTITTLVYSPVLANFFNGDDFVHLNWLHNAMQNPELIIRNFHGAWLDIPNARFYRPLISLFMLFDYGVWHLSGFGFHFTNLLTHLANVILSWLVLEKLFGQRQDDASRENVRFWAFLSATLFALYPLHPEAVSWITGRVDTIVTMFCLLNLLCYMKWRSTKSGGWFCASWLSFVCALLSKEMAVIQPLLLCAFEFTCPSDDSTLSSATSQSHPIASKWVARLEPTVVFWMILTAYFVMRFFALGTLIGGYDNSVLPAQGLGGFLKIWMHSATMVVMPFNKNLVGPYEPLETVWLAWLAISSVLTVRAFSSNPATRKPLAFLVFWLALSLVPLFKFFNISDDLQGSRLAYLPSVPLCAILSYGVSMIPTTASGLKLLKFALVATVLTLSTTFLSINNSAWATAGKQTQAILQNLNDLYKTISADTPVYIVGLPDNFNGAYVARNALDGMTKSPQIVQDATNCFPLDNYDRVFPFGFARNAIGTASLHPIILIWSDDRNSFIPLAIPKAPSDVSISWSHDALKKIIFQDPHQPKSLQLDWQPDGSLLVASENKRTHPTVFFTLPQIPCWYAQYLAVDVKCVDPQPTATATTASIVYSNDLQQRFELAQRVEGAIACSDIVQTVTFPLHSEITWAMGGTCHQLKLLLPNGHKWLVSKIALRLPATIMPMLSLSISGNQNRLGYVELNPRYPAAQLDFDVQSLAGASGVALECVGPSKFFDFHNTSRTETGSYTLKTAQGTRGTIALNMNDFQSNGIYEARLRALDASGKQIGLAGDHIVLTVSH